MNIYTKYAIAIGLMTLTFAIPSIVHSIFFKSDDIGLGWGVLIFLQIAASLMLSIIALLLNKHTSVFSIYSCFLGLSFAYYLFSEKPLYELIIPPVLLGFVLLVLQIRKLKKNEP